jgi:hypothetical protein
MSGHVFCVCYGEKPQACFALVNLCIGRRQSNGLGIDGGSILPMVFSCTGIEPFLTLVQGTYSINHIFSCF